jgi:biopolymer transport protein ExbB/TolQ
MGIVLGIGKVSATLWLKQNWILAPWSIRIYLSAAIVVLMLITSMGIFGFLSKAHSDQSLVSGDVQSKIAVYDEKIKTAKDNIDANRKALKQMDEAVDQVMGRSQDEKGADKAVAIRRGQQKERARLQTEIASEQKIISQLSEERAPIAAEVRKVEAEVGPIKYIAQFVYGEANEGLLEKAVTWVIIILIVVFDPLAVILLLASQISFQNFREREKEDKFAEWTDDDFEQLAEEELAEGDSPQEPDLVSTSTVTTITESEIAIVADPEPPAVTTVNESEPLQKAPPAYTLFVQNEEQKESNLWSNTVSTISQQEYAESSQDRLEDHIDSIVELVKTGHLKIEEVPKSIQPEVRAKL